MREGAEQSPFCCCETVSQLNGTNENIAITVNVTFLHFKFAVAIAAVEL